MDLGLAGRACIVTGASRGIGLATARGLAGEGARVLLVARGGDALAHAARECAAGGGEDNGDAHLKNLLVHHQAIVPITEGRLDLGPWQAIFYTEFDGQRPKRLIIKVMGE